MQKNKVESYLPQDRRINSRWVRPIQRIKLQAV
jgi:hypothetical protein